MAFTTFRGMKPGTQLVFSAFVILVSFLVVFSISIAALVPIVGLSEMMNSLSGVDPSDPNTVNLLKYFQVVQSIGLFVLPPFLLAWLFEGNVWRYLTLDQKVRTGNLLLGLLAVLAAGPWVGYLGELNQNMHLPGFLAGMEDWMRSMEDSAANLIDRFIAVETVWGVLFNLFMIAVIPAIGEELLFRGVVQKIFTNMTRNQHWGIWISAFLFSTLHMQFFGFFPRLVLGALFGYLLIYSGSMWLPILAHFMNNALGVLALHAEKTGSKTMESLNSYGDSMSTSVVMAVLSLALTIALVYILRKRVGAEA
ncbi:CPBP family intramembrane glutamic endopeptidase [uncultured Sunxiuqinia sp.]|uniref:CPBP family intramembrane glutamic endopeptidase n=1 Tax=uncultured Sunxiuqinia sp. TaxID=1573825 RepID=UPI00263070A4|nr:CPBP family intramembrane glutamic endopeptidase [uncultured Sunxiuqinia sp.]